MIYLIVLGDRKDIFINRYLDFMWFRGDRYSGTHLYSQCMSTKFNGIKSNNCVPNHFFYSIDVIYVESKSNQ